MPLLSSGGSSSSGCVELLELVSGGVGLTLLLLFPDELLSLSELFALSFSAGEEVLLSSGVALLLSLFELSATDDELSLLSTTRELLLSVGEEVLGVSSLLLNVSAKITLPATIKTASAADRICSHFFVW